MYDTDPATLSKALEVYRIAYGKGEIDIFELDNIIQQIQTKKLELNKKKNKKGRRK